MAVEQTAKALRNQELLRDMIEAVLNPPSPVSDLEILNPEIPEDAPGDKSVVLDVRVRLSGLEFNAERRA